MEREVSDISLPLQEASSEMTTKDMPTLGYNKATHSLCWSLQLKHQNAQACQKMFSLEEAIAKFCYIIPSHISLSQNTKKFVLRIE